MATVDLTLNQILDAVRQLPTAQIQRLREEMDRLPAAERALETASRNRAGFHMDDARSRRMSELLEKGNAADLSSKESRELDRLVREFEERTLALARTLDAPAAKGARSVRSQRRHT